MEFKTKNVNNIDIIYSLLKEKYQDNKIKIEYNDNSKEYSLILTDIKLKEDNEIPFDLNIKIGILLIKNKNKKIIDICLIDKIYYKELKKYSWCKSNKYIVGRIDNRSVYLHRYILSVLCKKDIKNKVIDHLDNNPCNNQINNLKICTSSENNHNLSKAKNKSSKYMGVSCDKKTKIYRVQKNTSNKILNAYFKNEHHAAHQYNLWCKENNFLNNLNIINEKYLIDFQPYVNNKIYKLPKNIWVFQNKYYIKYDKYILNNSQLWFIKQNVIYSYQKNKIVKKRSFSIIKYGYCKALINCFDIRFKHINYFSNLLLFHTEYTKYNYRVCNTLEEALIKLQSIKNIETNIQNIKRNKDDIAIIELFNNKKEKVGEVLLDDNLYLELVKYSWHKNDSGYAVGSKTTLKKRLHRYIFQDILKQNIPENFVVDHINNNRLDNRLSNLRIVSKSINSCNVKRKNGSSKYIGITKINRKKSIKWAYQLSYNGKHITKVFETEKEAMIARNNYIINNNLPHKLN
jgi:hypothetical protein